MNIKNEVLNLIESLPDNISWEDLYFAVYVRRSIEDGLADVRAGRVMDVEEVRARWGLAT
jgi:hypothetical protein